MLGEKKQGKLVGKQLSEQHVTEGAQTSELGRPLNQAIPGSSKMIQFYIPCRRKNDEIHLLLYFLF